MALSIDELWEKHRDAMIHPRQTTEQVLDRLCGSVAIEEIPEEQADPIFVRMTRYNFAHMPQGKPVDGLRVFRVVHDDRSALYYTGQNLEEIYVIVQPQTEQFSCNSNLLNTQMLVWQGLDESECRADSAALSAYLMYLEGLEEALRECQPDRNLPGARH